MATRLVAACPSGIGVAGSLQMPSCASCVAGRMEMHQQGASISEVLRHRPSAESPMLQRELASIHRQVCQHCLHALMSQTLAKTPRCWLWYVHVRKWSSDCAGPEQV